MDCLSNCSSYSASVMSPFSRMCVWLSIRPGSTVERLRSITCAPAGTDEPTSRMRSPSITMTAFERTLAVLPSIRRPQRMAVIFGADCAASRTQIETKRTTARMRTTSLEGEIVSRAREFGVHGKAAVAIEYLVECIAVGHIYQLAPHVFTSRQRPRLAFLGRPRTLD